MKLFAKRRIVVMLGLIVGLVAFGGLALAQEAVHWTYEGEDGPENWGDLSPDFALCSTGTEQSPVNIPANAALNPADLGYNYSPSAVNIFNNGHTIQVNYDPGSTLTLDEQDYELVQFHFHAASEHTNAGQHAPMEMHLVHQNADGGLAVVGVWLESGSENALFAQVFNNLPTTESEPEAVPGETVNADELLPAERTYHRYNGSLTTPPCTQDVKWIMLGNAVELSEAQIAAYTDIYDNNFRPVQSFNDRTFLLATDTESMATESEEITAENEEVAAESEEMATEEEPATTESEPATLPQSGGVSFPVAALILGLGALSLMTGTSLYLYQRRS